MHYRWDLVFLINLVLDLALLGFAARVARVRFRVWRLWVAALLGASLAVAGPAALSAAAGGGGGWVVPVAALMAASGLMVLLLVWPGPWGRFAAVFGFFWVGLAAAGGLLYLLAERYPALFDSPPAILVATGVGVALGGVHLVWQAQRERAEVDDGLFELEVRLGGARSVVVALLDSGNHLRTPVGRAPVAVVEGERLRSCLPEEVLRAAGGGLDALDGLPPQWQTRCQLVPYAAVGQTGRLLLVVRPDGLAVRPRGRGDWARVEGQIGLTTGPLDPEGRYAALLPGEMVAEARHAFSRRLNHTGERGEERPDAQVH
ncbi:MAG: sigma-E processing peptidase SpoIIGA [Symbiobacterium sp.]|uniref:sigma-E processing peptidase SpoIIGA n=1 Tax=Symbiobacterium sp. TaxID=1971213 RepID=UPI003464DB93